MQDVEHDRRRRPGCRPSHAAAVGILLLAPSMAGCGADQTVSDGASTAPLATGSPTDTGSPAGDPGGGSGVPSLKDLGWTSVQAPGPDNVRVLGPRAAIGESGRPEGPLLSVQLAPGEYWGTGEGQTSRAEVYGRNASPWSTSPEKWPDPPGSERWYTFSIYLPSDFATSDDSAAWLDLTQWKGRDGGSPPIAVEVSGDRLRLGGERANQGLVPDNGDMGALPLGAWTTLVVGIRFSTGQDGWVHVFRDGVEVVPRTAMATMDLVDGAVDPVYLKQGIYRSTSWTSSQTALFSQVVVTDTEPSA
jgi:hypothetical protein